MTQSFEQPPESSQNSEILNGEVLPFGPLNNRAKLLAELALTRVKTTFVEENGFDIRNSVLPKELIDGAKHYLAHEGVSITEAWPPRTWAVKSQLVDALHTFRLNPQDEAMELLDKDRVFDLITGQLVKVGKHIPGHDPALGSWRSVLISLHRLRTDEIEQFGIDRFEPTVDGNSQPLADNEWNLILLKVDEARPEVLKS